MSRLTHKVDEKYYPNMNNIVQQKDYEVPNYRTLIHTKLGKLEDLLEKYQIEDLYELELIIGRNLSESNKEQKILEIMQENKKYKLLEQELGCPLEVVFKALKEGITFEHRGFNLRSDDIRLFYFNNKWIMRVDVYIEEYVSNVYDLELKDYQKTWWFKGEK